MSAIVGVLSLFCLLFLTLLDMWIQFLFSCCSAVSYVLARYRKVISNSIALYRIWD